MLLKDMTIKPKDFVAKLPWLIVEFCFTHHKAPHQVFLILLMFSKHGPHVFHPSSYIYINYLTVTRDDSPKSRLVAHN
jgi:hypothetical protein